MVHHTRMWIAVGLSYRCKEVGSQAMLLCKLRCAQAQAHSARFLAPASAKRTVGQQGVQSVGRIALHKRRLVAKSSDIMLNQWQQQQLEDPPPSQAPLKLIRTRDLRWMNPPAPGASCICCQPRRLCNPTSFIGTLPINNAVPEWDS